MNSLFAVVVGMALFGVCVASAQDAAPVDEGIQETAARNKKTIETLFNTFCGHENFDFLEKYFSPNIIMHNPLVADGLEASKAAAQAWCQDAKKEAVDFKRISAEGDLVWIHYKINLMGADSAIVDIYRFENGMVVEHWDVIQPIPVKSANSHPMF